MADRWFRLGEMKAGVTLMLAAMACAACSSEGDRLAQRYAMLESNRAERSELCEHARKAASAYLASRDEEKFAEWKRREAEDCAAPARAATGPAPGRQASPAQPALGTIAGKLTYPSDHLPEDLTVCVREVDSKTTWCGAEAEMKRSGSSYTLRVPPGRYHVWARTKEMADTKAYYSQFVLCGLDVECKSHEPVTVQVSAGATRHSVDPGDWYDY